MTVFVSRPPAILEHMNNTHSNGAAANEAVLLAPRLAVGEVTSDQLQSRIKSTIRVENQAAAIRAEAVAELRRREGAGVTETVLQEEGLLARGRAKSELETAQQLEQLPKTREGFQSGEISPDNARIIAGAAQRGSIDEQELAEIAKTQAPDKFAGTVRRHERDRSPDDGEARLKRQRSRRYARIKKDLDDGMMVLYGRFDPVTGARIETALAAKMRELWRAEDPGERISPGQRMADALEQLITGPRQGKDKGRAQDVKLLLIADYNTLNNQIEKARLGDGTPIPASELRRLACDAQILPAVFAGRSHGVARWRGCRWIWVSPGGPPTAPNAPLSPLGTAIVWDAAPKLLGAKPTTSSTGPTEAPPASTTWSSYVGGGGQQMPPQSPRRRLANPPNAHRTVQPQTALHHPKTKDPSKSNPPSAATLHQTKKMSCGQGPFSPRWAVCTGPQPKTRNTSLPTREKALTPAYRRCPPQPDRRSCTYTTQQQADRTEAAIANHPREVSARSHRPQRPIVVKHPVVQAGPPRRRPQTRTIPGEPSLMASKSNPPSAATSTKQRK